MQPAVGTRRSSRIVAEFMVVGSTTPLDPGPPGRSARLGSAGSGIFAEEVTTPLVAMWPTDASVMK
jgi:hypothetical protein